MMMKQEEEEEEREPSQRTKEPRAKAAAGYLLTPGQVCSLCMSLRVSPSYYYSFILLLF